MESSKKKRSFSKQIACGIAYAIAIIIIVPLAFIIIDYVSKSVRYYSVKTGAAVTEDGCLTIVDQGTYSRGTHFTYQISDEDVIIMEKEKEYTKGYFTGTAFKLEWKFRPTNPGTATITVNTFDGGRDVPPTVYNVTVDDSLNIRFEIVESSPDTDTTESR